MATIAIRAKAVNNVTDLEIPDFLVMNFYALDVLKLEHARDLLRKVPIVYEAMLSSFEIIGLEIKSVEGFLSAFPDEDEGDHVLLASNILVQLYELHERGKCKIWKLEADFAKLFPASGEFGLTAYAKGTDILLFTEPIPITSLRDCIIDACTDYDMVVSEEW